MHNMYAIWHRSFLSDAGESSAQQPSPPTTVIPEEMGPGAGDIDTPTTQQPPPATVIPDDMGPSSNHDYCTISPQHTMCKYQVN